MIKKAPHIHALSHRQAGNIFFMLFGAVALVGAIGAATMSNLKGIATSMSEVTRKEVAEQKMTGGARLSIQAATSAQANSGDCDSDGWVEPLPFKAPGAALSPIGGGLIPDDIGAEARDPWGTLYGYCVWDGGVTADDVTCGGPGANRLAGSPSATGQPVVAIISAGKDRKFSTTCNAYVDTMPADGNPDTPLIGRAAGGDDIIMEYTYNDASGLSGDDLWKIRDTDPTTAMIDKNIEVTGGGQFGGALNLMSSGLVLPADPGNDSVTGACDADTDQQVRVNIGTSPPSFEICHGGTWEAVSLGGNDGLYDEPTEIARIVPDDQIANQAFGLRTDIYGNTFIVGAYNDNQYGAAAGAAYIYTKSGNLWVQGQKLISSDLAAGDQFGTDVAINNHTIAIGARSDNSSTGAVYIFEKSGGAWVQTQKLTASDATASYNFGSQIDLFENTLLIGSNNADDVASNSGAAYIFEKVNGTWTQIQRLKPADLVAGDNFGFNLDLEDSTAVIISNGGASNDGAAYVFTKTGSTWTQTQKLLPADLATGDRFGYSIGISGNTLAIGSIYDDDAGANTGAVYIFNKSGSSWSQTQKILPNDAAAGDEIGVGLDIYGDTLIFGSIRDDDKGTDTGAAYVFKNIGGTWTQTYKILPSDTMTASDEFGRYVSLDKDTALISSYQIDTTAGANSGATYVFEGIGATKSYSSTTPATGWYMKGLMKDSDFLSCRTAGRGPFAISGQSDSSPASSGMDVGSNYIYSAGSTSISAFSIADGVPTRLTNTSSATNISKVWKGDSHVFTAGGNETIRAYSFNGTAFTEAGSLSTGLTANDIWGDRSYIYIAGGQQVSAYTFNGTTFAAASATAGYYEMADARDIWGDGKFLYVTDAAGSLSVLAFNGTSFSLIDSISFLGAGAQSYGDGKYIYVAADTGLFAFSFDGETLEQVAQYPYLTDLTSVWGDGANIYIGNNSGYIRALSFNGTSFQNYEGYRVGTGAAITDIHGDGTYIYVAQGSNPVTAFTGFGCGVAIAPNPAVILAANKYRGRIATSSAHSCGIKEDNTAWCWGAWSSGRLGNGGASDQVQPSSVNSSTTSNSYIQIGSGQSHTCALKTDGTAWCWGSDAQGQLGNGDGLTADQTTPSPVSIVGTGKWSQISVGRQGSCGIQNDGTAWCWGEDTNGQLGNGASGSQSSPQQISDPGPWVQITAGYLSTCGIKTDGSLWCWGDGQYGKLGNGTTITMQDPTPVAEPGPWVYVGRQSSTTCGIKLDGTAWCWGQLNRAGMGYTAVVESYVPKMMPDKGPWLEINLSVTNNGTACGVKVDGSGWCWGFESEGRLGNGGSLNETHYFPERVADPGPWASIILGGTVTCGIKIDGSAWCWGDDSNGRLGNGSSLTANQAAPSRVYNFSNAAPWQWNDTQTSMTKAVSTAPVIIPPTSAIGYDGTSGGLSFSGTGTTVLKRVNGDVEFAVDTTAANTSAQLSFDAAALANARSIGIDYQNGNLEFFTNDGTASNWAHSVNPAMFVTPQGNIGIGNGTTANARLDLSLTAQGGLKISDDTRECTPSRQGTIKYTSGVFYFCSGTAWVAM